MDTIIELYTKYGAAGYIGENVSQYEHAMQCYLLAEEYLNENKDSFDFKNVSPYEIKLGAFLHDVGHLLEFNNKNLGKMGNCGVLNHEIEGSKYLKKLGISDNICSLAENHINTKRYLITKNKDYYNNLSNASKGSFRYQGGTMNINELTKFEKDHLFFWHLNLRKWDDKSKSTDPELLEYIKNYDIRKIFYEYK